MRQGTIGWMAGMLTVGMVWVQGARGAETGTERDWINTAGGDYSTATNWSGNNPGLTTNDKVYFKQSAIYTGPVTFSTDIANDHYKLEAAGGASLTVDLKGHTWTNLNQCFVGDNTAGNVLTISNGTVILGSGTAEGWGTTWGSAAQNNILKIVGSNTVYSDAWNYIGGANGPNPPGGYSYSNRVEVTAGALYLSSNGFSVGQCGYGCSLLVSDTGSVLLTRSVVIGASAVADGGSCDLSVTNGGRVTLTGSGNGAYDVLVGGHSVSNTLWIVNNGVLITTNAGAYSSIVGGSDGATAQPSSSYNRAIIANGGMWSNDYRIFIGYAGIGNGMIVSNNGVLTRKGSAILWVGYNGTNSYLTVSSGGQILLEHLFVGNNGTGNVATVTSGGMLECGIEVGLGMAAGGVGAGNVITNKGGIYQFTTATPTIVTNGNKIYITDATLSYRGLSGVDVKRNWVTNDVGQMTWAGANGFRLNNATNAASGQDYTFATGLGATNYARLELLNGALYRGGAVTIGNGGWLVVSNGASTISNNLTMQSGGNLVVDLGATNDYSRLNAGGNVALGGATLQVVLRAVPTYDAPYKIIDKTSAGSIFGAFASGDTVAATFGGRIYTMVIRYNGGDGNDVELVWVIPKGTIFSWR